MSSGNGFPPITAGQGDLQIRNLRKTYGDVVAVDTVSLVVHEGEFLTLLGPSGSGKTTTLMMIAGFVQPTAGTIDVNASPVVMARRVPPVAVAAGESPAALVAVIASRVGAVSSAMSCIERVTPGRRGVG